MANLDDVLEYDGQMYVCERFVPYVRKDGSKTELAIWRSKCVVCRQPFKFTAPASFDEPTSYRRRCDVHKRPGSKVKKKGRF